MLCLVQNNVYLHYSSSILCLCFSENAYLNVMVAFQWADPVFPRNLSRRRIVVVNEVWRYRFFLLHSVNSDWPMEGITQYIFVTILWILEVGWVGGSIGFYLSEKGTPSVLKLCLWLISPSENNLREKKWKLCLDWTLKCGILSDIH